MSSLGLGEAVAEIAVRSFRDDVLSKCLSWAITPDNTRIEAVGVDLLQQCTSLRMPIPECMLPLMTTILQEKAANLESNGKDKKITTHSIKVLRITAVYKLENYCEMSRSDACKAIYARDNLIKHVDYKSKGDADPKTLEDNCARKEYKNCTDENTVWRAMHSYFDESDLESIRTVSSVEGDFTPIYNRLKDYILSDKV